MFAYFLCAHKKRQYKNTFIKLQISSLHGMLCQTVVGKEKTQLLPPKAVWDRAQPVISFRTDPIQEGAGLYV